MIFLFSEEPAVGWVLVEQFDLGSRIGNLESLGIESAKCFDNGKMCVERSIDNPQVTSFVEIVLNMGGGELVNTNYRLRQTILKYAYHHLVVFLCSWRMPFDVSIEVLDYNG